jgi:hypothetical protein
MRVAIEEARGYGISARVDDPGVAVSQCADLCVIADGTEAAILDRQRLHSRCIGIARVDVPIDDDEIGSGDRCRCDCRQQQ